MSYQRDREQFIARMTAEGLSYDATEKLLRCATTIQRLAELACSSEAADRDRIACPAKGRPLSDPQAERYPCLCDRTNEGHETIARIQLQDFRTEQRAMRAVPQGWRVLSEGDPRGYTLKVIPPSYAERNQRRDRFNLDSIGVPARDSRLRF